MSVVWVPWKVDSEMEIVGHLLQGVLEETTHVEGEKQKWAEGEAELRCSGPSAATWGALH